VVVLVLLLGVVALVFICCCRRGGKGKPAKTVSKPTAKTFHEDAYKLPAYYPPGGAPDNKPGADTTDLARLSHQDPNKVIYGSRPGYEHGVPEHVQGGHPPANGAVNMAYMEHSYSNSQNGGSVNSQDSLWQVKAGGQQPDARSFTNPDNRSYGHPEARAYNPDTRSYTNPDTRSYTNPDSRSDTAPDSRSFTAPDQRSYGQPEAGRPFTYDPNNYDPAQANYLPDQTGGSGYGDYGHYPPAGGQPVYPEQGYPVRQEQGYPTHDEYGRPYEAAEPYGAVGGRAPRPMMPEGGYRDVSGLPDPYSEQEPDNKPQISFDESLESGYSTPNSRNRRVIREIIV